jgi:hypothetical protein
MIDLDAEVPSRGVAGEDSTIGFGRQEDSNRPGLEEARIHRERSEVLCGVCR